MMSIQFRRMICLHLRISTRINTTCNFYRPYVAYRSRRYSSFSNGSVGSNVGGLGSQGEEDVKSPQVDQSRGWGPTFFKMFESAATTMASILVLA